MNVNLLLSRNKKSVGNKENILKEGKIPPKKSDVTGNYKNENKNLNRTLDHKYSLMKTKSKILEKSEENKKIIENILKESKEISNHLNTISELKSTHLSEPATKSKKEIKMTIKEANEFLNLTENTKVIYEDKLQTRFSTYERKV
jgi:hypothetical protein